MSWKHLIIVGGIIISLLLPAQVGSQLQQTPDWYTSNQAGFGLSVNRVSGDLLRDLVTTNVAYNSGCWFNDALQPAQFYLAIQNLPNGHEAKFGQFRLSPYQDLAIAGGYPTGLKVYLNDNDGSLDLHQTFTTFWEERIAWGNADGDILDDLVAAQHTGGLDQNVYIYLNNNGSLVEPQNGFDTEGIIGQVQLAQLDGDVWEELIVSSWDLIKIFDNIGEGTFVADPQIIDVGNSQAIDFVTGDLDRDGDLDLVVSATSDIKVYKNNGDGSFDDVNYQMLDWSWWSYTQVALGEYNYDGLPDIGIAGERQALLFDGPMGLGHHQLRWSDEAAPSGVYLLQVAGEGWREVRKVALLR